LKLADSRESSRGGRETRVLPGKNIVVRGQALPPSGTTLTGTTRVPGYYQMEDGSKVDAVVTWTFKPGR
jgi:hypothetical protein